MTAVEWLYERLERMIPRSALYNIDKMQYFEQAKEMEKQQKEKMYSEEEVLKLLITFSDDRTFLKKDVAIKWFEQFKKK
jgi:hypothetical protein